MVHGSSLFQRGETQCLSTVTVGGDQDIQHNQSILGELPKHLLVHYSFPPFSNCEVSKMLGTSRREVGHGILAGDENPGDSETIIIVGILFCGV